MGKVTIKDVAREAGVSISTVSNALNDVDVLRPETKAHILEVAERLHYVPNLNGRNLKAGATKVIGIFVPFITGPYMGGLADAMASQCREAGYELNVFVTQQRSSIMTNLLGGRMDGAVMMHSPLSTRQEKQLQEEHIPMVYLNKEIAGEYQSSVCFDSYQAGRIAADYMYEMGIEEPGFVTGPITFAYDSSERARGFLDGLKEHKMELKKEFIWQGAFSRETTYQVMKEFIEQQKGEPNLPRAIFAANDLSAIGCMEALTECGISVPETVKVIGCDDIELGRYMRPSLTTIRTNFAEQGITAVDSILRMIQESPQGEVHKLSCCLVERDSTL